VLYEFPILDLGIVALFGIRAVTGDYSMSNGILKVMGTNLPFCK
jgi:hypothetical protein